MGKFSHEFASWGDVTWKERHANGVPVKMDYGMLTKFINTIKGKQHALYGIQGHDLKNGGDPYAVEMGEGLRAAFCNFRYKPEWLEKKGQTNN